MKTQFDPTLTSHEAEHRTWILGLSFVGIVMVLGLSIVPFATVSKQQAPEPGPNLPSQPPPNPLPGPSMDDPGQGLIPQEQEPGSGKDADQVPSLVKGPALSEIFPLPAPRSKDGGTTLTVDALVKEDGNKPKEDASSVPLAPAEEPEETPVVLPGVGAETSGEETTESTTRPEQEDPGAPPTAPTPHASLPSLTLLPPVLTTATPGSLESLPAAEGSPPELDEVPLEEVATAGRPPDSPISTDSRERMTIELPKPKEDSFFNNSLVQKYRSKNPTDEISNRDLTEQMGDHYKKAGTFLKYAEKFPDWAQHYNMIKNEG